MCTKTSGLTSALLDHPRPVPLLVARINLRFTQLSAYRIEINVEVIQNPRIQ